MNPITLAIPTYNRFEMCRDLVESIVHDPRIDEIIISDDASTDGSFDGLSKLEDMYEKVYAFRNGANVDCYRNKRMAVSHAANEWLILFDDDNELDSTYIDAIEREWPWDNDTVYCPEFAKPHFDFRAFAGQTIHRSNVAEMIKKHGDTLLTAFNAANYFVNRDGYLRVWDGSVNPHTADSIFQIYNWLNKGNKVKFVRGMQYLHRVHAGSHYKTNNHKTGNFYDEVVEKLKGLR